MRPKLAAWIVLALLLAAGMVPVARAQSRRGDSRGTSTNAPDRPTFDALSLGGPDGRDNPFTEQGSTEPDVQAIWRVIWHFEDVAISRPQLLTKIQDFLKQFPASQHAQRARDTEKMLTRMIAEDEVHAKHAPADLEALSIKERVPELIFRLRDQNGVQMGQPDFVDIFFDVRGSTNTPAHQLARIGYPAVPQLIAALEDRTFTRSVGYWRNFRFSHRVLTVGDCALAILERIAGVTFMTRRTTSSYLSVDGNVAEVRKAVEVWYADLETSGEKGLLIRATEAGDTGSVERARMLVERYPDAAAEAIMKGIRAVKALSREEASLAVQSRLHMPNPGESVIESQIRASEAPRRQLMALLAGSDLQPAEPITKFLLEQVREAPDPGSRLQAAVGLRRRGHPAGVDAMIQEWPELLSQRHQRGPSDYEVTANLRSMAEFLACSDSPKAIEALTLDLASQPLDLRRDVIRTVGYGGEELPSVRSAAALSAVEDALVFALADLEQTSGGTVPVGAKRYSPRICDIAGTELARRWPEKYWYDPAASLRIRDRQRIECQNVWRKGHNLASLTLPVERTIHVDTTNANQVTLVEWAPDSAKPTKDFTERMAALLGKPLTVQMVTDVCRNFESNPETESSGLEVQYRKDEDLTGVTVRLRLLPGSAAGNVLSWGYVKLASLNQDSILDNYSSRPATSSFNMLGDLLSATRRALDAAPETTFMIYIKVTANEGLRR